MPVNRAGASSVCEQADIHDQVIRQTLQLGAQRLRQAVVGAGQVFDHQRPEAAGGVDRFDRRTRTWPLGIGFLQLLDRMIERLPLALTGIDFDVL